MQILHRKTIATPLGSMLAIATDDGICSLEFTDMQNKSVEIKASSEAINESDDSIMLFNDLEVQLSEYFEGKRKSFELKFVMIGTEFQKKVWTSLMDLQYGEVSSYIAQAELLGSRDAIRAVAAANGSNRLLIVVPCHRIIGLRGDLTGYRGGLYRKKYLLALEARHSGKTFQTELFTN